MDENQIQITDENGVVVGSADMLEAFEKQLIRSVVYVMLVDSQGRYLLQKRSHGAPNYPSYWDASAGGHVDVGEEPEAAAYRELAEELGVQGVELGYHSSFYFEAPGDGRTYRYFAHVYTGDCPDSLVLPQANAEVDDVQFYTRSQLDALPNVTPITRQIVSLL